MNQSKNRIINQSYDPVQAGAAGTYFSIHEHSTLVAACNNSGMQHHCCFALLSTGALVYFVRGRQRQNDRKVQARASAPSSDTNARMVAMRKAMAARRRRFRDDATKVVDGLFLGGVGAAQAPITALRARGVTHILTVSATPGVRPETRHCRSCNACGLRCTTTGRCSRRTLSARSRSRRRPRWRRCGAGALLPGQVEVCGCGTRYQMYDAARKGRKTPG